MKDAEFPGNTAKKLERFCSRFEAGFFGKPSLHAISGLKIDEPNQVWATDITYIPIEKGFVYLTVIMDWYSRKILSWRLSNTLDSSFCIEALEEALYRHGRPEILNSDQGSQ